MDAILRTAFVSTADSPKGVEIGPNWEEWVRMHLGEYLDVLPYSRLDLMEYTKEMAQVLGVNPGLLEAALRKHFPTADSATVTRFLADNMNENAEFLSLGMVYAYNLRRKTGLQEEHIEMRKERVETRSIEYAVNAKVLLNQCTRWLPGDTAEASRVLEEQWQRLTVREKAQTRGIRGAMTSILLQ